MIDLCVGDGIHKIDLLNHVTKLVRPRLRINIITQTWFESMMLATSSFLQFTKDLFQTTLANSLLGFWCDFDLTVLIIIIYITFVFQVIYKITETIFICG